MTEIVSKIDPDKVVLAIDPGNIDSAYVLLHGDGRIKAFGKVPNAELVVVVRTGLYDYSCCEMICSYGMPVGRSVFDTCVFIGQILTHSPDTVLIPRLEVKLCVCRSPKANDSSIRTALLDLYGPPGKKHAPGPTYGISGDVWAALALGVTFLEGRFRAYELSK